MAHATSLIRDVCQIAGPVNLIDEIRVSFEEYGILEAIQKRDDDVIFNWLAETISYQGISDQIAMRFIEEHGRVDAADIKQAMQAPILCTKLTSYWHFQDCGYRKTSATCNMPRTLRRCPLPRHDLRNGNLNRAAYSLFLFLRDVAGGDLVAWFDGRLTQASSQDGNRARNLGSALIEPLNNVFGVSDKLWSMCLSSLLLAGDPGRPLWVEAGAGMIVIDSLCHNWLHRTGILARLQADHLYGPGCYGPRGCAAVIEAVAPAIDARDFNPDFPASFPRFVQNAIWRFCAGSEMNRCNGNRINDRERCLDWQCPLFGHCARIALGPGTEAPVS